MAIKGVDGEDGGNAGFAGGDDMVIPAGGDPGEVGAGTKQDAIEVVLGEVLRKTSELDLDFVAVHGGAM